MPEGDYKIGVTPKNAGGISLDFPEVLTIKVENRSAVVFEDLINNHPGEDDSAAPSAVTGGVLIISGTKDDSRNVEKMKAVAGMGV